MNDRDSKPILWTAKPSLGQAIVWPIFITVLVVITVTLLVTQIETTEEATIPWLGFAVVLIPVFLFPVFTCIFGQYTVFADGTIIAKNVISTAKYKIRSTTKYSVHQWAGIVKSVKFDSEVGFNFNFIDPDEVTPILDQLINKLQNE